MSAAKNTSTDLGGKVLKRKNLKIIINDKGRRDIKVRETRLDRGRNKYVRGS